MFPLRLQLTCPELLICRNSSVIKLNGRFCVEDFVLPTELLTRPLLRGIS